jgi:hypothetical protein
MHEDVVAYFNQTVIPLVTANFSVMPQEMSIQITGSYALGVTDEFSDLDANIWIDDDLWAICGEQVQALLDKHLPAFAVGRDWEERQVAVRAISWLGAQKDFLRTDIELPWDRVELDQLHWIQNSLVLCDPHDFWKRLKEVTAPERFPALRWQELLLAEIDELTMGLSDLWSVIARGKLTEMQIIFGACLERLLHIGFLADRCYYPWRKHLRWSFDKLAVAPRALPYIDEAVSSLDWDRKLSASKAALHAYADYIIGNEIVPSAKLASAVHIRN